MGRNGEGEGGEAAARVGVGVGGMSECCMCGDYGLSSHLFICKLCRFRSQHKYCSNLYPEAESYHICNWCLSQNGDKKGELQANTKATSPNSSSSSLKTPSDHMKMSTRKRVLGGNNHGGLKDASDHIKKQKKSSSAGRKRVTTDHGGSNIGKKTRSEEVPNGGVKVFKNKVRRYKLLDEVPS
ncbi:hypothetical protein Sango_2409700 [Sesamum angolense]|uniref:PHD-type zinc finger plants domain-containing protein n=1 Tax=Sesamum angolense TaxID=2727404 RepID=A0AAE1W7B2_9LAMI|nr:hypothetical protein Sango_2409700 [Sesamum angolense]